MWALNYVTEGVFSERNVIYIAITGIQDNWAKTKRRLSQHLTRL